jgi:type IV pilus assembly protein PilA
LVELLVVIAVIAIVAAIAIPGIGFVSSQADLAKNQRNAQNIVSMANAALAAGYDATWNTPADVIDDLIDGISVPISGGQPVVLRVSDLSSDDFVGATRHIIVERTGGIIPISRDPDAEPGSTVRVSYSAEPIEQEEVGEISQNTASVARSPTGRLEI